MKIKMNFGIVKTVLISAVLVAILGVVGLDIAMLVGVKGIVVQSIAIPILSLVASLAIAVICLLLLLNSYYKFTDKYVNVNLGFMSDRIYYLNIVCLKQNIENGDIYIVADSRNGGKNELLKTYISKGKQDDFIKAMREHVPNVQISLFTVPKKDKKNKK